MPSEFDRLYLRSIESAGDRAVDNVRLDLRGSFGGRHFDCCRGCEVGDKGTSWEEIVVWILGIVGAKLKQD